MEVVTRLGINIRTSDLSRHLLCAVPQLQNPYFARSVVLILEHNQDGAFGLVLNKCLSTGVSEIAQYLGLSWAGPEHPAVRSGGPVERVRGFLLHNQARWDPYAQTIVPGLWLTTSLDAVIRLDRRKIGGGNSHFLFLLGYAGWTAAQLEAELAAGSWLAVPLAEDSADFGISPQKLFTVDAGLMWKEILRTAGIDPAWIASRIGRTRSTEMQS